MSTLSTVIAGVSAVVSVVYPPAAPIIGFLVSAEPYVEKAIPIIQLAIKEGPAAFSAAQKAAPEFFEQLKGLSSSIKLLNGDNSEVSESELANIAAHVAGVDPPGWTHEETQRWWDRAQGTA